MKINWKEDFKRLFGVIAGGLLMALNLKTFVSKELTNHYVFDNSIDKKSKMVTLKVIGEGFKKQEIEKLEKKMVKYNLGNYKLKIEQLSNQKYLTAQDLSKYLKEENLNEKLEKVVSPVENQNKIALENDLKTVENVLYKNFSNSISGVKIGKLIDTNNNENFIVLVIGNETMTDEISEKIKNLTFIPLFSGKRRREKTVSSLMKNILDIFRFLI